KYNIYKRLNFNHHSVFIIINFLILFYLVIFKVETTTRLGALNYPGDVIHLGINVVKTNFIEWGIKLPNILWIIISRYYNPEIFYTGSIICILIYCYLFTVLT